MFTECFDENEFAYGLLNFDVNNSFVVLTLKLNSNKIKTLNHIA